MCRSFQRPQCTRAFPPHATFLLLPNPFIVCPLRLRCSYEEALGPGADCSKWITHVNHLGEELGVDYVWYRNDDARHVPMEPAWESIVYQVSLNHYRREQLCRHADFTRCHICPRGCVGVLSSQAVSYNVVEGSTTLV